MNKKICKYCNWFYRKALSEIVDDLNKIIGWYDWGICIYEEPYKIVWIENFCNIFKRVCTRIEKNLAKNK